MRVHSSRAKVVWALFSYGQLEWEGDEVWRAEGERDISLEWVGIFFSYLKEVDMDIKACRQQSVILPGESSFPVQQTSPSPILNGVDKLLVGFAKKLCLWIDKAFAIIVFLACDWSLWLIF